MILEDSLEKFGYVRLVVADINGEYPLRGKKCFVVWDPHNVSSIYEFLTNTANVPWKDRPEIDPFEELTKQLFPSLESQLEDFVEGAMLWLIQGAPHEIAEVFDNLAQDLMGGPRGADDDTFDYWPNAFCMLMELARDLIKIGHFPEYRITTVQRVIESAIALCGPLDEWEADHLLKAVPELQQLHKEVSNA